MSFHRFTSFWVLPVLVAAASIASADVRSAGIAPELVRRSEKSQRRHSSNAQATLAAVDGLGRLMIRRQPPGSGPLVPSHSLDLAGSSGFSLGQTDELPPRSAHANATAVLEEQTREPQEYKLLSEYQLVFPEPQHPHHLWSFAFIERRWRAGLGISTSAKNISDQQGSEPLCAWFSGLLLSLAIVGLLMLRAGESLKVDLQSEQQEEIVAMRGRPCWAACCACSVALLSLVSFLLTLFVLKAMSWKMRNLLPQNGSSNDDNGLVVDSSGDIRYAKNPGERAYEAGQGVALSVALACFVILRWRRHDSVQITWALLAQFAVRGATFSAILAAVLELIGSAGLNYEGITHQGSEKMPDADQMAAGSTTFGIVMLMLVVGISEEFAKACAVVWGTWFSVAAVQNAGPRLCGKGCRTLVESPRALMLVGLSVGCGFMTVENAGYLVASSLSYDKNDSAFADRIVRVVIILTRAGLNLHPWLTGITSARVARIVFSRDDGALTIKEFFQAMSLSVLIHSMFDFFVLVLPGALAVPLPLSFWFAARYLFSKEWATFESAPEVATGAATLQEHNIGEN